MLTQKQKDWLLNLSLHLQEGAHEYQIGVRPYRNSAQNKIFITFPYGDKIKDVLDKDNRNFDYKFDAVFNRKLIEAMYLIVFVNKLFKQTDVLKLAEKIAEEELARDTNPM